MSNLLTIILAAGLGKRMKSDLIKVLHPVGGKAMVQRVIDNVLELSSKVVIVVGHQGEQVKEVINNDKICFVEQKKQLGTGHAVKQAERYIKGHQGPVLVLYGDTPLITKKTIENIIETQKTTNAAAIVLTAFLTKPDCYGRIVRNDAHDQLINIVEEKDANKEEKLIKEINTGVYCFDSFLLGEALDKLDCNNAQGEYYLTDTISYLTKRNKPVIPVVVEDNDEIIGINDRKDLVKAAKILRQRINDYHLENGVTIIDPETTYIDSEVKIEADTLIYPFTYIKGKTKIGSHCVIGPHCCLVDAIIGNSVNLKANCNICDSLIDDETIIGPFAYIRPGSKVAKGAKVGDFVELKKAKIGQGTKVPHLSYVGDAEIGEGTNIGAGTIFANYDGQNKYKTIVGKSAFIGSNTTLVAPVKIGDKGKTGSGAVVIKDVPANATVVGVPAHIIERKTKGDV